MAVTVNSHTLKKCLRIAIQAKVFAMIDGSPGIGKSACVWEIAEQYNLKLIDVRLAQCDPTDLNGFPHIFVEKNRAGYVPMETFPLEGDELPINPATGKRYQGWLIFFDELNSAPRGVQAASYKIVLDRMIGQQSLHSNVVLMGAGNLDTDNAIVEELSSALQSRMLHLTLASNAPIWLDVASKDNIDPKITSYVRAYPKHLNTFNPDAQGAEKTYACERTWYMANKLLNTDLDLDDNEVAVPLLAGTLGEGVARTFRAHTKIFKELPEYRQIVKSPLTTIVPTEISHLWALAGSISHQAVSDDMDSVMDYTARLPKEYQVVCLREMGRRNIELLSHPKMAEWQIENGKEFF